MRELLGNIQQLWTAVWPKGSSQFLLSMEQAVRELNEPRENSERLKPIDDMGSAVKKSCLEIELFRDDDFFFLAFLRAKI